LAAPKGSFKRGNIGNDIRGGGIVKSDDVSGFRENYGEPSTGIGGEEKVENLRMPGRPEKVGGWGRLTLLGRRGGLAEN